MKKPVSLFYHILIFVLAQLAWFSLLGLWIYWYVTNYIVLSAVGEKISPQLLSRSINVTALVGGIILLVFLSVAMSLIFRYLNLQLHITRMYDNFIANITHELKSPLASIQMYLETMKIRKLDEPKQKEFLNLMLKDTSRLKHLINSILEISILEQKKIAHDFNIVPAEKTIHRLVEEAREQFKLDSSAIKLKGQTTCDCVIDQNAFRIVIDNLIDNAIKYSREKLEITFRFSSTGKYFVTEVTDKGIGISARDQKKIFHKFYRIYNADSPNVKGTGLGLYWVQQIIKFHGGRVSVFSEGKNRGTTFRIELPVYQESRKRFIRNLLQRTRKNKINRLEADRE